MCTGSKKRLCPHHSDRVWCRIRRGPEGSVIFSDIRSPHALPSPAQPKPHWWADLDIHSVFNLQ